MVRLAVIAVLLLAGCNLFRAPKRELPSLSAGTHSETLRVQGIARSYLLYTPKALAPRAPLLVLLHGSRQTGEGLRRATGYAFDRLADRHGFVAVYPDGYKRRWNDCRAGRRSAARKLGIDDVGFMVALIDALAARGTIDPARVFLAGYSGGGQLAFRMAVERPERVAGIAAFGASLPTEEHWGCATATKPVPVLLINGTADRINPHAGGRVSVFGFRNRGHVRSSRASAEYFAQLAGHRDVERTRISESEQLWIEQLRWHAPNTPEVMLLAVHGGGHVIPGPSAAFPRILGKVSAVIDAPHEAWQFFSRQMP